MHLCESGKIKLERQVDRDTIINLHALPQLYRSFTHDLESIHNLSMAMKTDMGDIT